jgi:phosphoenolpyruvate-protein kinase (PTS system EI component)
MFGGANSHMAIRASELNLPAAIGVGKIKFAQLIKSKYIKLDPTNKKIEIIE